MEAAGALAAGLRAVGISAVRALAAASPMPSCMGACGTCSATCSRSTCSDRTARISWEPRRFTIYYFVCVHRGGREPTARMHSIFTQAPIRTIGASGGIFGILLLYGMAFPHRRLLLLFPPIPMPAWLFVTLYGVLELCLGVFGTSQGVAHFAHLGGMATGYVLIRYWRARDRQSPRPLSWTRSAHAHAGQRIGIDRQQQRAPVRLGAGRRAPCLRRLRSASCAAPGSRPPPPGGP